MGNATQNGNGRAGGHGGATGKALTRRTERVEEEATTSSLMQLPPWLAALRDAMGNSIQANDLKDIMAKQIEKAKDGDMKAASFVFKQAKDMLAAEQKRVTIVQNNFYDGGAEPQTEIGGVENLADMRRAARAGEAIPVPRAKGAMTDEQEKEFRRRKEAESQE